MSPATYIQLFCTFAVPSISRLRPPFSVNGVVKITREFSDFEEVSQSPDVDVAVCGMLKSKVESSTSCRERVTARKIASTNSSAISTAHERNGLPPVYGCIMPTVDGHGRPFTLKAFSSSSAFM